ncbi:MAG: hypothetical protein GDA56_12235 [Hormoscilla sp. GM7CHS1pb]|nr:hypothetical protein [Hormoscilla sp. GM7CHS1pb]
MVKEMNNRNIELSSSIIGHSDKSKFSGFIPNKCGDKVQIKLTSNRQGYLNLDRVDFTINPTPPSARECPSNPQDIAKSFEHATANAIKAIVHQINEQQE